MSTNMKHLLIAGLAAVVMVAGLPAGQAQAPGEVEVLALGPTPVEQLPSVIRCCASNSDVGRE